MSNCLECKKNGTKECPFYDYAKSEYYTVDGVGDFHCFERKTEPYKEYHEGPKGLTEGTEPLTMKYYIEETDSVVEAKIRAGKDRHFTAPGEMAIENIISGGTLELPKYKAQIDMGGFIAQVNKTYTEEQIEHIRDYFGWEVKNYE